MSGLKTLHSDDTGKLLLRLMIGGLMLFHGVFKVQNGIGKLSELVVARGLPSALTYGVHVGEVLAPLMIILGSARASAGFWSRERRPSRFTSLTWETSPS
ncbi:MAG: DoxX family protein [Planctomycetaceae bacterium]|nr:DoxX family protein [Planctomycetaceae bacterium]